MLQLLQVGEESFEVIGCTFELSANLLDCLCAFDHQPSECREIGCEANECDSGRGGVHVLVLIAKKKEVVKQQEPEKSYLRSTVGCATLMADPAASPAYTYVYRLIVWTKQGSPTTRNVIWVFNLARTEVDVQGITAINASLPTQIPSHKRTATSSSIQLVILSKDRNAILLRSDAIETLSSHLCEVCFM